MILFFTTFFFFFPRLRWEKKISLFFLREITLPARVFASDQGDQAYQNAWCNCWNSFCFVGHHHSGNKNNSADSPYSFLLSKPYLADVSWKASHLDGVFWRDVMTKPYLADVSWKTSPLDGVFWKEVMTSLTPFMLVGLEHGVHCGGWKYSRGRTFYPTPRSDYKSLDKLSQLKVVPLSSL